MSNQDVELVHDSTERRLGLRKTVKDDPDDGDSKVQLRRGDDEAKLYVWEQVRFFIKINVRRTSTVH